MKSRIHSGLGRVLAIAVWLVAAACTSEKIVYRSGTNFAAPPSTAANFIGYI